MARWQAVSKILGLGYSVNANVQMGKGRESGWRILSRMNSAILAANNLRSGVVCVKMCAPVPAIYEKLAELYCIGLLHDTNDRFSRGPEANFPSNPWN
jgi:hypothetical protein